MAGNAKAKEYAARIHDQRFKTWVNLGIGTLKKPGAGEKFIARAMNDTEPEILRIIQSAIEKAIKQ